MIRVKVAVDIGVRCRIMVRVRYVLVQCCGEFSLHRISTAISSGAHVVLYNVEDQEGLESVRWL